MLLIEFCSFQDGTRKIGAYILQKNYLPKELMMLAVFKSNIGLCCILQLLKITREKGYFHAVAETKRTY